MDKMKCVLCHVIVGDNSDVTNPSFIPMQCYIKYGNDGHKLCSSCWWERFAIEETCHKCPGCNKENTKYCEEIDLTK